MKSWKELEEEIGTAPKLPKIFGSLRERAVANLYTKALTSVDPKLQVQAAKLLVEISSGKYDNQETKSIQEQIKLIEDKIGSKLTTLSIEELEKILQEEEQEEQLD